MQMQMLIHPDTGHVATAADAVEFAAYVLDGYSPVGPQGQAAAARVIPTDAPWADLPRWTEEPPVPAPTLRRAEVLAYHPTPAGRGTRAGAVIIARSGDELVTAWLGRDGATWDSSWCWGHYFDHDADPAARAKAWADYSARVARGY